MQFCQAGYKRNPYVRAIGILYARFGLKPKEMWAILKEYLVVINTRFECGFNLHSF